MKIQNFNYFNIYNLKNSALTQKNVNDSNISNLQLSNGVMPIFTGNYTAPNAEPLRKAVKYKIPCLYTGKILIPSEEIQKMLANNLFYKPLNSVLKALKPYEDSLYPIEKQVFEIFKIHANKDSKMTIEDVIRQIAPEHEKLLLNIQTPIFKELEVLAKKLPENEYEKFTTLMEQTYKKLHNKPTIEQFNTTQFHYELEKIANRIKKKNNTNSVIAIKKIQKIAKKIPNKINYDNHNILKRSKRNEKQNVTDVIREIEKLIYQNALDKDIDIFRWIVKTKARIFHMPIVTPFNRKSFIHELNQITENIQDKRLARDMSIKACELPTSQDNLSAFIMKEANSSSEKIGYDMLIKSSGTIEHIIPTKCGGIDCLTNYALATSKANSDRAHRSFAQQLAKHPETYQNAQKYINRLIELYNNGIFPLIGLTRNYIENFARLIYRISPEDNRLVLDIRKLKD